MAEQFKVGDWVEVVNNVGNPTDFAVGDIDQVEKVAEAYNKNDPIIYVVGKSGGMYSSRFKKASPPLPDVFQFRGSSYATPLYTATKISNGYYRVTWAIEGRADDLDYSVERVTKLVRDGVWKILPSANGVDGQGKALNFTKDMLKPMMRVTTMNGDEWIAAESVQESHERYEVGDIIGVSHDGFNRFYDNPEGDDACRDGYVINEVYRPPVHNYDLLNPSKKGPLIWKRVEQPKATQPEPSPLQKRLDYLQVHIDAVKENVESLEKELSDLKQGA